MIGALFPFFCQQRIVRIPMPTTLKFRSMNMRSCLSSCLLALPCSCLALVLTISLTLSYYALCYLTLSCLAMACLVLSCLVLSYLALSCLVLLCLMLSCVVLCCVALCCVVLSCLSFGRLPELPPAATHKAHGKAYYFCLVLR